MEQIVIGGIIAFLVTFYAIPVIIKVADLKKLYDVPDERKIHKKPIPSLGGFGIFVGFAVALLLMLDFKLLPELQYYFAAFLIIFFLGIKDDIIVLSAQKKFIGQLLVAAILMFKAKLLITNMHGFLGIEAIKPTVQYFLTLFTIIVIINAYNLIDGVDGLAGSLGLITSAVFGTFFLLNNEYAYAALGFALAGSILSFLIYNFYPAKIFMGDTGSMLIGLVNTILVIRFIEMAPSGSNLPLVATPALGFGILVLPLMDTLRVFGIRIFHGRSPFSPDRNHLHHILLDRGLNHRSVTLILAATAILFIAISYVAQPIGTTYIILGLAGLFFAGVLALYLTRPRMHLHVVKSDEESMSNAKVRLVSIYTDPAPVAVDEE
ncbi:MAG: undecaprenyl-phosphate N-acetylglucosaminyl 1-phosphate transferase [Chitinophagaceae bacterium]|jgi:UDP-N-acetylmuramyl pentapeptide phosphotransferase/UDP-N-acetylglucosamine-1-phosphate transferase|nr:undecaprenyl-phosphate N-acetylglucosaminyl 1-phosphate transferase [Chitinophagaceae bacterium]